MAERDGHSGLVFVIAGDDRLSDVEVAGLEALLLRAGEGPAPEEEENPIPKTALWSMVALPLDHSALMEVVDLGAGVDAGWALLLPTQAAMKSAISVAAKARGVGLTKRLLWNLCWIVGRSPWVTIPPSKRTRGSSGPRALHRWIHRWIYCWGPSQVSSKGSRPLRAWPSTEITCSSQRRTPRASRWLCPGSATSSV